MATSGRCKLVSNVFLWHFRYMFASGALFHMRPVT